MKGSQMNTDYLNMNYMNVGAEITFDHHIHIRTRVRDAPIMLDDIDVRELLERLKNTEMVCKELYSVVAKQSEFINALWYAPGAPGTWEAKEEFEKVLGIAPPPPAKPVVVVAVAEQENENC
jgi:hypothetical protein